MLPVSASALPSRHVYVMERAFHSQWFGTGAPSSVNSVPSGPSLTANSTALLTSTSYALNACELSTWLMPGLAARINNTNQSFKLSGLSSTYMASLYFRVHVSNGRHPQPTSLLCGCRNLTVYGCKNGHLTIPPSPLPLCVSYIALPANFWDGK
jgi:hypothetical protein